MVVGVGVLQSSLKFFGASSYFRNSIFLDWSNFYLLYITELGEFISVILVLSVNDVSVLNLGDLNIIFELDLGKLGLI